MESGDITQTLKGKKSMEMLLGKIKKKPEYNLLGNKKLACFLAVRIGKINS